MTPLAPLDAACLCAEHGFHLIPVWRATNGICPCPRGVDCISPGKHPAIDAWQIAASTDLTVLRDWFAPGRHNLGVVCGPSRVVVVDVDPRNGGDRTFAALVAELGELPDTVTADTGGGGQHYVFRRPEGDLVSKLGNGIELLRDGRQFLVEPSLHPSGNTYRWREGHAPDNMAIATLPEVWIQRIRQARPAARPAARTTSTENQRASRAAKYIAKIPGAVSGQAGHTATFNAVAHVMIGFDLDEATTRDIIVEHYNDRCDPPWNDRDLDHKLRDVAKNCKRDRGYLLNERPRVTNTAAAAAATPAVPTPVDYQQRLLRKGDGISPRRGYENVAVFVRYHPDYAGKWSLDQMTNRPWFDGKESTETQVHEIRGHIDRVLGFSPPPADVQAAIAVAAADRPFHPIRQYLRSLDWDGVPRLRGMACEYLHTAEPLHAEMVAKFMIGAAARALRPGCKLDTALMLVGRQSFRKSTFFQVLGGTWHSDSAIDIKSRDGFLQLHSTWIYELAELENVVTGRSESHLKAWLTSSHDNFRAPYGRETVRWARSGVICGTTNRGEFLTDDTGSRRFWIVPVVAEIPFEALAANRDQLWAEAVCAVESGEQWWLDRVSDTVRERANEEHTVEDAWLPRVTAWLETRLLGHPTTSDILAGLGLDTGKHGHAETIRVGRIMTQLGWRKFRAAESGRPWRYRPPD